MASRFNRFTQSSNPILNERVLGRHINSVSDVFTVQTAISKTFLLIALLLFTAVLGYRNPSGMLIAVGAIGGLIVVVITAFKMQWAPFLAPVYALLEGLFVGAISAMYASMFNGIIFQAVSLTVLVFVVMLVIYKTRIIKVDNKFRTGVIMATGAIALSYLVVWILSLFGIHVPYVHSGGPIGILISIGILGIAALNLLLDFDLFERAEESRAPGYMEWYAGMGLLVTLVWIYIEVLRLLSKIRE